MNDKNINFRELENALIKLYGKIEIIEELQKHKGDKFNIFSILKMERLEVNTHSAFLYELIDTEGTHYQGDKYLRIFIDKVLKIENFDFENVKVGRETFTNTSRKIDFTIKNKDYYIAIEMKIDARDQDNQLSDYYKYANNQNKEFTKVYYLTLDGKDASLKSFKSKEELEYERISFQFHILDFIEKSIEKSSNLPIIRESLIQYKNLILKITNQTTQELRMENLEFINNPEIAKAATFMSKNLDYIWANKELLFWEELERKLNEYSKDFNLDKKGWIVSFYDDEIKDNKLNYIKNAKVKNMYFNKDDYYFKICSHSDDYFDYQMVFEDSSKDINILAQKIRFNPTTKSKDYSWINSNRKLNFCKDYDDPTYDIFDDGKLDEIVQKIYKEIESYMNIIIKELK